MDYLDRIEELETAYGKLLVHYKTMRERLEEIEQLAYYRPSNDYEPIERLDKIEWIATSVLDECSDSRDLLEVKDNQ